MTPVDDVLEGDQTFAKTRKERMMTDQADGGQGVVSQPSFSLLFGRVGVRSARNVSIKIHADAEPLPIGIFFRQGEDERGQLTKRRALVTGVDATFGLAEENHVGRQSEVFVIFQRISTKEFGRLRDVILFVRMATPDDDHVIEQTRRKVPFRLFRHRRSSNEKNEVTRLKAKRNLMLIWIVFFRRKKKRKGKENRRKKSLSN